MISLVELNSPSPDFLSLRAYRRIQTAGTFCGPVLPRLDLPGDRCEPREVIERGQSGDVAVLAPLEDLRALIPALEAARIPWELIPTLCPARAALVSSGVDPGRDPVVLVDALPALWDPLLEVGGTLVVPRGGRALADLMEEIRESGLPPGGRMLALEDSGRIASPEAPEARLLLVTSRPANPAEGWVGRLPLSGRSIVVTREADKSEDFALYLERLGAEAIRCPTLSFEAPSEAAPLVAAVRALSSYHWILFTSPNGVRFFLERVWEEGRDLRSLGGSRLAAIGPSTARALEDYRLRADLVPQEYVAEGLLQALAEEDLEGKRVLLPRAAEAREVLPQTLRERGAQVDVVAAYRTVIPGEPPAEVAARLAQGVDLVTFTSSSTVKHFHRLIGSRLESQLLPAMAIGPVTAATARDLGYRVVAVARRYTVEGMLEAILEGCAP